MSYMPPATRTGKAYQYGLPVRGFELIDGGSLPLIFVVHGHGHDAGDEVDVVLERRVVRCRYEAGLSLLSQQET